MGILYDLICGDFMGLKEGFNGNWDLLTEGFDDFNGNWPNMCVA